MLKCQNERPTGGWDISMTQLSSHTFAHLTGSSFRLKAKLLPNKIKLGLLRKVHFSKFNQKMTIILEDKVLEKLKLSKNVNDKNRVFLQ